MAGGRRRRLRVIECAAWRRKRETERRGVHVFKNRGKRGRRKRGADRQERRFRGGGEGRLAGWRRG